MKGYVILANEGTPYIPKPRLESKQKIDPGQARMTSHRTFSLGNAVGQNPWGTTKMEPILENLEKIYQGIGETMISLLMALPAAMVLTLVMVISVTIVWMAPRGTRNFLGWLASWLISKENTSLPGWSIVPIGMMMVLAHVFIIVPVEAATIATLMGGTQVSGYFVVLAIVNFVFMFIPAPWNWLKS